MFPFSRTGLVIIEKLKRAGYSAFFVGGCVRDCLLEKQPHDWDMCASASPDAIAALFPEYEPDLSSSRFGTAVLKTPEGELEITSMRREGGYSDRRRPDSVEICGDITQDLSRRDFTVNAMAYDGGLVDPFGGRDDLKRGILRAVGDADEKMSEDPLRILRGLRFMAALGLSPEESTLGAMRKNAPLCRGLSAERLREELFGMLTERWCGSVLLRYGDIFTAAFEELAPCLRFEQKNRHHVYDVWGHTAMAIYDSPCELAVRLTLLFHDCEKPRTVSESAGERHFYGHVEKSAETASRVLLRLGAPRRLRQAVEQLILFHDNRLPPTGESAAEVCAALGENAVYFCAVQRADNMAQSPVYRRTDDIDALDGLIKEGLRRWKDQNSIPVKAGELIDMGFERERVSQTLKELWLALIAGRTDENGLRRYAGTLL